MVSRVMIFSKKMIRIIILAIVIFLAAFASERKNYCSGKCPEWMREWSFAHRGYCFDEETDENTIQSFSNAIERGYAIELDLRYTKDMVPMVIHDDDLFRLTGKKVKLSSLMYDEAKDLTLLKSGDSIPTLSDVLLFVNGRVPLLIEIKSYHIPGEFEKNIVEILDQYDGFFVIQSYNPFALNYVKNIDSEITVGLLLDDIPFLANNRFIRVFKDNLFSLLCHPAFITYHYSLLDTHEIDLYRSQDNIVLGFLFRESDTLSDWYLEYVDGIIFENDIFVS